MGWRLGLGAMACAIGATATATAGADPAFNQAELRAIATSGFPRASVVSVKSDMVVAIRSRGTLSEGGGVIEGVGLQGEVASTQAGQFLGYRSMRSTVNIDCVRRRDMVVKMTVFTEPNAKGVAINRHVPGGWVQPSPDAYLADVIRAVCATLPRQPGGADIRPIETQAPVPATGDADRPVRTSLDARAGRAPASPPVEAPPAPAAGSQAATAAPPTLHQVAPLARARGPGKVAVQIAAAASEAQARQALSKLRSRIASPLTSEVRSVVVEGRTFHRALIVGFQTRAEAQAFCSTLKADCFVR